MMRRRICLFFIMRGMRLLMGIGRRVGVGQFLPESLIWFGHFVPAFGRSRKGLDCHN
jgi:hypothetical protein